MAADAVIIDDGGSTRVKQIKGAIADGKLDDLISDKTDQAKGKFKKLRIVFFDGDGEPHGPIDQDLNPNDRFEIQSGNGQKVVGELSGQRKLSLSLESGCVDVEPLVDAKQHKQQRRYIVSNAGPIVTVSVNGAAPIFDFVNIADHGTSVYTMVVLKQHTGA
jgi:hypothetical protein